MIEPAHWCVEQGSLPVSYGVEDAGEPMGDEQEGSHEQQQHSGSILTHLRSQCN